jgi:hypothetical protein
MPAAVIDVKATPVPPKQLGRVSRLGAVKRERLLVPLRYVIYGPHGVGKTSLAADAPEPIFFDIEEGSSMVNVARYPFRDGANGHIPTTYAEVLSGIDDLTASEHKFKTLVLDTADRLESLIWRHMMDRDSGVSASNSKGKAFTSIEDYGYGKGYIMAVEEWRALCARLDRLRAVRGMDVVIIAHEQIRPFKNPEGEDYDRYQLRINDKAAGFLKEWSDVTAFACFEDAAAKTPGARNDRPKGISTGRRILRMSRTAAFDAKSRISLPDEIEISIDNPWAPLADAVRSAFEDAVPKLVESIAAEVARVADAELGPKVDAAVKAAVAKGDVAALARYLNDMKRRPAKEQQVAQ